MAASGHGTSAGLKALALAAALLCSGAAAGTESQGRSVTPTSAPIGETVRTPTAGERNEAEDGEAYQALSSLAALGLGILGLIWVRRHTAEL